MIAEFPFNNALTLDLIKKALKEVIRYIKFQDHFFLTLGTVP